MKALVMTELASLKLHKIEKGVKCGIQEEEDNNVYQKG